MASPGPSLHGAFDILGAAERDRLAQLKHKLRRLRPGSRESRLLHAMVLLALGQDTEARISLESLKVDTVAQLVARQWAGVDSAEAPGEPPDLSCTVARLYHLLAEERLCPASARDAAYRVALRDLASRDDHQLGELQREAWDRCGSDIMADPSGFQTLRSDQGCLPPCSASPSVTRSQPRPIDTVDWSRGQSLHSSGTASVASHLEISQSPTVPFLSAHRGTRGPSKLCDSPSATSGPQPVPTGCQEPEEVSWPLSVETSVPSRAPDRTVPEACPEVALATLSDSPAASDTSVHCPVECTEVSAGPALPLPPTTEEGVTKWSVTSQLSPPVSADGALQSTGPGPPAQPPLPQTSSVVSPSPPSSTPPSSGYPAPPASTTPVLGHSETSEQKFYNFVVIHARADEHVALRIREKLESLGVPDGATFCEEFQVPGRGELHCLQDAIDHSGFTILLLTASFDCRLSQHQVNHTLMNSLTQSGRQDCVIPLLPRECSRAQLSPATTSLLHSLVWLDEHSPVFARKVANTFKPQKLQALSLRWKREQEARALKEQSSRLEAERQRVVAMSAAYRALQEQMDSLGVAFRKDLSLGGPATVPSWPGWPQYTPFPQAPSFPQTPSFPQAPCFPQPPSPFPQPPGSYPLSSPFPSASPVPQTPGHQPFIIHHAQMVQLGVNNHMWGQTGAQASSDRTACPEETCPNSPSDQGGPSVGTQSDHVEAHLGSSSDQVGCHLDG